MKILHTADWHLGKRLNDYTRIEEQKEVLNEICDIADKESVDVILVAGDLYDNFNPGNDAIELFYQTMHRLAKNGERAVIAIAGNHDSPDRIEAPDPLARACGIVFLGRPQTEIKCFELETGLKISKSAPGFIELKLPEVNYPLRLLLTPYANETSLKKFLGEEDKEEALRSLLKQSWQQHADNYCDDQGVNILMAHLYFMQKDGEAPEEPDDEKPILHLGGAQAIFSEDIPEQMQYVALGHLHRYQTVAEEPCPMLYSSSPLGYSFSEANQQKFVVIIEAEPKKKVQLKKVSLNAGRKLVRKRFEEVDQALNWLQDNPKTFVELTLVSNTFIDAKTKKALYQAHDGIVSIIPEISGDNTASNEGTSKIDLNKDVRELFKDYFQHRKGQEPNDQLLALLNEVLDTEETGRD
ncbi:exonuclease SbcCD subunit D [Fulvivirgaceae bacterium BMA10]|uniref:Nuclease SbcCD subunit D n=1 Tax=Splendidivirga corallicola TaxID=3051826 RepID=A0ABT8KS15_9BACT|nr:exonuclease SbcCD subunit D [Fulvivirgaceae bacterium BMA10]